MEYGKACGEKMEHFIRRILKLDFFLNPTMAIYSAGRDVMRARNADWHQKYTLPSLMDYFQPSRENHGAYWFYWTTHDEVAWKKFYQASDANFTIIKQRRKIPLDQMCRIYYQTQGSQPYATRNAARSRFSPTRSYKSCYIARCRRNLLSIKKPIKYGVIREGLLADLLIVDENPLENLCVLYGTGAVKLNDETKKQVERVGGVDFTIKDGSIVYDAKVLLNDVEQMVEKQKFLDKLQKTKLKKLIGLLNSTQFFPYTI